MNEYKGVKNTYIKQRDIKTLSKIHIFNKKMMTMQQNVYNVKL